MSFDIQNIGIERLSVGERLELINFIWESLPEQVAADVPEWHLAELAKRRESMAANPAAGKLWREVLDSLEAKS